MLRFELQTNQDKSEIWFRQKLCERISANIETRNNTSTI